MAKELQCHHDGYKQIEYGKREFSLRLLELFREKTGLDPYVFAYFEHHRHHRFPRDVNDALYVARDVLSRYLESVSLIRHRAPLWS